MTNSDNFYLLFKNNITQESSNKIEDRNMINL